MNEESDLTKSASQAQIVVKIFFSRILLLTFALTIIEISLPSSSAADVIFLKNGKIIPTTRTWQDTKKIYYEKDGNVYSFSKDLVERIDANSDFALEQPGQASPKSPIRSIPVEVLEKTIEIGPSLKTSSHSGVVQDGVLNLKLLEALQAQARKNVSDREIQAQFRNALVEVINWHWGRNEWNAAEERLDQYLQFEPESFEAGLLKASIYVKKGAYKQSETILLQLGVKNPDSAELNYLLGMTYYLQDKNEAAYRYLKMSLASGFRPDVDQLLKKIENENRTENEYKQSNSLHFVVRYEGTDSNRMLYQDILKSLEQSYQELEQSLNYSPRETLVVVLYPDEVFQDVTKSPGWVGAMNDGKIRFPIKGLSRVDPSVQRILKHELTHSFIRTKAGGNCPLWLNEGLAQFFGGDSSHQFRLVAKQALIQQKLPLLSQLQGTFLGLSANQAAWAYQQSLLATEYLVETYGLSTVGKLLEVISATGSFETALSQVLRRTYPEMEKDFQEFIQKGN